MIVHRRVKICSDRSKDVLDIVRLDGRMIDVDTIGDGSIVVRHGRNDQDKFGGLSVALFDETHDHKWPPSFVREIDKLERVDSGVLKWGSKKIARWHCYKRDTVPDGYQIHPDNPPVHAILYPLENVTLQDCHEHAHTGDRLGRLPNIRDGQWQFCCNLLMMSEDDYINMRGGGEPEERKPFRDDEVTVLVHLLQTLSMLTDFVEECEECVEAVDWIKSHDVESTIESIPFSRARHSTITRLLRNMQLYTEFENDCDAAARLLLKINHPR